MSKVTQIVYSKKLNNGKFDRLDEIAKRLGKLRAEVWQRFGSVQGLGGFPTGVGRIRQAKGLKR